MVTANVNKRNTLWRIIFIIVFLLLINPWGLAWDNRILFGFMPMWFFYLLIIKIIYVICCYIFATWFWHDEETI